MHTCTICRTNLDPSLQGKLQLTCILLLQLCAAINTDHKVITLLCQSLPLNTSQVLLVDAPGWLTAWGCFLCTGVSCSDSPAVAAVVLEGRGGRGADINLYWYLGRQVGHHCS